MELKIQISVDELRKRTFAVGTPAYGSQCSLAFCSSLTRVAAQAGEMGITSRFFHVASSMITVARNIIVARFLATDAKHLLFIDADEGFEPEVVWTLLALQSDDSPYDVIGAHVSQKSINWAAVAAAVRAGVPNDELAFFAQGNNCAYYRLCDGAATSGLPLGEPVELSWLGTGFMLIHRRVFERLECLHPEWRCKMTGVRATAFFQTGIDNDDSYHGEDVFFTRAVREAGMRVWLCPWLSATHWGLHEYKESIFARDVAMTRLSKPEQAGVG